MVHIELSKKLIDYGFECYLVGGCVRDDFMNIPVLDYDLVTNAKPEEISDIFKDKQISNVGETFKVSIVDGIEIATFRKDTYFGNSDKNCEIEYANYIEEDLARRDLTINSIARCLKTNRIIDPFNGIKDLMNQKIRFVGNANSRIIEDPNRMIRAARFYAKLASNKNFNNVIIHKSTIEAVQNNLHLFEHIAKERIRLEIFKAMKIKNTSYFFVALHEFGMLKLIFPSLDKCWNFDGGPHHDENLFDHMMIAGDFVNTKCGILKLTAYLHDVGKVKAYDPIERSFNGHEVFGAFIVEKELENLRFSNDEIKKISKYIRFHMRSSKGTEKATRKLVKELNENGLNYRALTRLKCADRKGNLKKANFSFSKIKEYLNNYELLFKLEPSVFSLKDLAVNGNDIIQFLNIQPGRIIGILLNGLLEAVYDEKIKNNKDDLLNYCNFLLYNKTEIDNEK